MTQQEATVFQCVTNEPKHIDGIMNECRIAAGTMSGVLITLELKGLVKQLPGKYYVRHVV
jgi:DNA processing protein